MLTFSNTSPSGRKAPESCIHGPGDGATSPRALPNHMGGQLLPPTRSLAQAGAHYRRAKSHSPSTAQTGQGSRFAARACPESCVS